MLLLICLLAGAQEDAAERLKAAVTYLASDEMKGRRAGSPEGEKAARWMADQMEKIGLRKGTPDGYLQPFKIKQDGSDGFNVVGRLDGTGDEFVVLGCHHDHLGVRNDQVFNGADDNASGCAVLLEVARACVASKIKPRRTILFCSFDAEERLLGGSNHFVHSGLVDMSKVAAMVCLDMMGGNFFPRDTRSLYALGAENSPEIRGVLKKVPAVDGLDVRPMGVNLIEPLGELYARSDYGSFRLKKVPFVFFSSGQPWHYHKPEDDVERLNFGKMEKGARFVRQVLLELASLEVRPTYVKQQGISLDDLSAVSSSVTRVLEHPEDLDLTVEEVAGLKASVSQLEEILKSGVVGPEHGPFIQKIRVSLMNLSSRRPKNETPKEQGLKTERFDRDPGWDGHNNRLAQPREIRQDFGETDGKIGGLVTPAAEPAYYAKALAPKTLKDRFSASGTLVVEPGGGNTLVGFFNSETVNEWRTPNSIVFRINGRGDGFHLHLEYATAKWRAGGVVYETDRKARLHPSGARAYRWTLAYADGTVTATLDGEKLALPFDPGHLADGGTFNRFGILNVMKSADGGGTLWLADLKVEGDGKWESLNSRRTYTTQNVRPRFDFGWSPTGHAGGAAAGEMGGLIFRGDERYPDKLAYYGDRLQPLTLDRPLKASGKIALRRAVTDSTVLIGFFHSTESVRPSQAQSSGIPENFLGAAIEGPSREGFLFYPVYGVDKEAQGGYGAQDPKCPHIYPDGASHDWTLIYSPEDGLVTATLDGKGVSVRLTKEHRGMGAKFDRFGIVTTHIDGNGQHVFFDDLTYTVEQ